jgi:hypothetical protein
MANIEVHIDLAGETRQIGIAHSNKVRGSETVLFEYADEWLDAADRFSIEPALALTRGGWSLSPAYDLNPVTVDLKARVLSTNIDLDESTCSLDLLEDAAEYFGLALKPARIIIKEVATATATWRGTAKQVGARASEINRMASAFEHDDLVRALAL